MSLHKTWQDELEKLTVRQQAAVQGGGEDRLEKLRQKGMMTAREKVDYLLDPSSFMELNMLAEHQCHDFGMDRKKFPGDGVVTGHGSINGRKVFIFSEDTTVLGGSTGKVHGAKIHNLLRRARETMLPVICLYASAGARIQEGMDNVFGVTGMFHQNALNSGIVPQIAAIMGACTGGAAYSAVLCDFVFRWKRPPICSSPARWCSRKSRAKTSPLKNWAALRFTLRNQAWFTAPRPTTKNAWIK